MRADKKNPMPMGKLLDFLSSLYQGMMKTGVPPAPIMLKGPSGIGKTAIVAQVAKMIADFHSREKSVTLALNGVDIRYGFSEIFWPDTKSMKIVRLDTDIIKPDLDVFFVDEAQGLSPEGAAEIRTLLHADERRIGRTNLPSHTWCFLASNLKEEGGLQFRKGLMDEARVTTIDLGWDHQAWLVWAQANGVREDIHAWVRWMASIVTIDKDGIEQDQGVLGAIPGGGRTLMQASREMSCIPESDWPYLLRGKGFGDLTESFMTMRKAFIDCPTPQDIWADPMGARIPTGERAVGQFAVIGRLTKMMEKPEGKAHVDESFRYIQRLSPEMTIMAVRLAMQRGGREIVNTSPSLQDWLCNNKHLL